MQTTATSTRIYVLNTASTGHHQHLPVVHRGGVDLTISPNGNDLFVVESTPTDLVVEISTSTGAAVLNIGAARERRGGQNVAINPAGGRAGHVEWPGE